MKTQCCVCFAIKTESGWKACNEKDKDASHTYFPKCVVKVYAEIEKYKKQSAIGNQIAEMEAVKKRKTRLENIQLKIVFYVAGLGLAACVILGIMGA